MATMLCNVIVVMSNTASHFCHEKSDSRVSRYGAVLGGLSGCWSFAIILLVLLVIMMMIMIDFYSALYPQFYAKEVSVRRVAGLFPSSPFPNFQCDPVGAIPKKHSSEWHTIYHLSYPEGDNANSYIAKDSYPLQYVW